LKERYKIGEVKESVGGLIPIHEVKKASPRPKMTGQVFQKSYSPTSDISTESIWRVPISQSDVDTYENFNGIVVHNSSDQDIDVRFNGSTTKKRLVKANTTLIDSDHNFWKIDIYNRSSITDLDSTNLVVEISKVN